MKALVTGGAGFLGGVLCRMLYERGDEVRSFDRNHSSTLATLGIEQIQGDLTDAAALCAAAEGVNTVFHVAARPGVWGAYDGYYQPNVVGTQNVLAACRKTGVARLSYTSSPSVVFDGSDMAGVDESVPYPPRYHTAYPHTKAKAERLVLAANSSSLSTVALRPHLIWGPGDNHLVPRILERGRKGQLRRIGTRPCRVDTVYVENAAEAHLLAADSLGPDAPCAGKAYFIANNEPIPVWDMVDRILAAGGIPPVQGTVPVWLAYGAGALLETLYRALRIEAEPRMTRFVARELSTEHWFDLSAAQRDFGYQPRITLEEGLQRLARSLQGEPR